MQDKKEDRILIHDEPVQDVHVTSAMSLSIFVDNFRNDETLDKAYSRISKCPDEFSHWSRAQFMKIGDGYSVALTGKDLTYYILYEYDGVIRADDGIPLPPEPRTLKGGGPWDTSIRLVLRSGIEMRVKVRSLYTLSEFGEPFCCWDNCDFSSTDAANNFVEGALAHITAYERLCELRSIRADRSSPESGASSVR